MAPFSSSPCARKVPIPYMCVRANFSLTRSIGQRTASASGHNGNQPADVEEGLSFLR